LAGSDVHQSRSFSHFEHIASQTLPASSRADRGAIRHSLDPEQTSGKYTPPGNLL
jgi:hypothetical protein